MPDDLSRRGFMHAASTTFLAAAALEGVAPLVAAGQVAASGPTTSKTPPLAPPNAESPDAKVPTNFGKRVGFAVVGLGKLAIEEILPAFGLCERSKLVALVSGHREKAEQLADHFGVARDAIYGYDNFEDLANNPAVDVVYIVLPNSMHAEFTIRALKMGKHVLCEKPMAASSDEAKQMIAAAKSADRKLMIAYRMHYEPHHLKAIELARDDEKIGTPIVFEAHNCQNTEAPNIRLSKKTAGGPVGDVGVYCFNAARYILGEEPTRVYARAYRSSEPRFREVPAAVSWTMDFPSGAVANCACSFNTPVTRSMKLVGTKGYFEIDNAFAYNGLQMRVGAGKNKEQLSIREQNQFQLEMDHFAQCVTEDLPPRTPGEEGLQDMLIQEAIQTSANENRPVEIRRAITEPVDPYVAKPTKEKARIVKPLAEG